MTVCKLLTVGENKTSECYMHDVYVLISVGLIVFFFSPAWGECKWKSLCSCATVTQPSKDDKNLLLGLAPRLTKERFRNPSCITCLRPYVVHVPLSLLLLSLSLTAVVSAAVVFWPPVITGAPRCCCGLLYAPLT